MDTGVHKSLRRQDITFEEKDQSLRDDVRTLGAMVGDLIREQNGDELFELVESARLRAIRRREGNEKPGEELDTLVKDLDPGTASQLIRGFSTYFQMVNTAEKVHRIRRRRDYLRDAWWMSIFPGLAIFAAVLFINLLGDGLRDALDPKMRV